MGDVEPGAEIEDLDPGEAADEVRGGKPPRDPKPTPPATPPGVPIPYPN